MINLFNYLEKNTSFNINMTDFSKKFVTILGILCFSIPVFSQVVKTPFPVTNLSWSQNNESFAFTEENSVFLRDSRTYLLLDTLPLNDVDKIMFSNEGKKQVLLAITKNGVFSVYDLIEENNRLEFERKPYFTIDCSENKNVRNVAFSKNSDYVAAVLPDNSISLFFKLRFTKDSISRKLVGHKGSIYNLNFSKNAKYLISTSQDGNAIIWDCRKYSIVSEINGIYTQTGVPAVFMNDSQRIIACDGQTSFGIFDFDGNKLVSFDTLNSIRHIKPLADSRKVAILTEKDEIEIYDLQKNKWIGYIPSYDPTVLTDFEFNKDDSRILIGYESGSIFEFTVKDVMLDPGEKPPKKIQVIGTGSGKQSRASSKNRYASFGESSKNGSGLISSKEGLYLGVSAGVGSAPSPYMMTTELSVSVISYDLLNPFYVGACISPFVTLPKKDFPYKYYYSPEENLDSPLLCGAELYIPFGLFVMPFESNDIGFCAEIFVGGGAALLWNKKFSSEAITSDLFMSFFAGTKVGISWKFLEAYICAKWDSVQKLMISGGIGASFKIGGSKQK